VCLTSAHNLLQIFQQRFCTKLNIQDAKAAKKTKINKGTAETLRETRGRFNGKKRKDYKKWTRNRARFLVPTCVLLNMRSRVMDHQK
jgi:hypothetical protein